VVGSAVFRFPVFCAVCPIGVATRGMFHLKAWTSLTGQMMPILLELYLLPVVAVLLSLREKRFFCRKICPVGAVLNVAGSISPFLKPKIQAEECIMKGCPKTCEDYHLGYCGTCRQLDAKACERVCPQGINWWTEAPLLVARNVLSATLNATKVLYRWNLSANQMPTSGLSICARKNRTCLRVWRSLGSGSIGIPCRIV
jgi:ferredoxin